MNFINNQINTAMMKKLLFAGTAVLALSATAVQAETVTNGGVTYSYTIPDNITWTESNNKASATLTTGTDGVSAGYLSVIGTYTTTKTATATVNPTATAVAAASVDFSSWSDNTTFKGYRSLPSNNVVYVGDNVYSLEIQRIIEDGNVTLYTWDEVKANANGNYFAAAYKYDNEWTTDDPKDYTSASEFEEFYDGSTVTETDEDTGEEYTMEKNSANDFMYYFYTKKVSGRNRNFYVGIYKLVDQTTNNIDSTLTVSFEPTTIPAGVITANVKSLTIGSNITSIANNAFENATGITYVEAEGAYIDVNNTYLYTADKTTLRFIGKNYASEALEVTSPTTAIGSYATVGFENNQVIYYNSTITTLNTTGQAAVFVDKNPHIDWSSTSSDIYVAAATSYVDYSVLNSELSRLTNTTSCVDLRKVHLKEGEDISLRVNYGNIMVLLPNDQGVAVGGTNVIYLGDNGYVCDNLVLSDTYNTKAFYSPLSFIAAEATYDRVFTSNNSTICLPFSFNVPNTLTVATMANSNSEGVIFAEVTETQSGKPYLIFSNSDNATIPTMYNVSVSATPSSNKIGEYEMIGVYKPTPLSAADGNFYGFSSNNLVKITGTATANVKVFRAYLSVEGGSAATMRVSIEAENETNAIEELEATNDDDAAVYNLNGQKIDSKAAGFQILSNGTKRIIK